MTLVQSYDRSHSVFILLYHLSYSTGFETRTFNFLLYVDKLHLTKSQITMFVDVKFSYTVWTWSRKAQIENKQNFRGILKLVVWKYTAINHRENRKHLFVTRILPEGLMNLLSTSVFSSHTKFLSIVIEFFQKENST